VAYAETINSL
jgi:chromosome segregation ATPase